MSSEKHVIYIGDKRVQSILDWVPWSVGRVLSDVDSAKATIERNNRYNLYVPDELFIDHESAQNKLNEMIVDLVIRLYVEQDKER